jgi:hypothetical protein
VQCHISTAPKMRVHSFLQPSVIWVTPLVHLRVLMSNLLNMELLLYWVSLLQGYSSVTIGLSSNP